MSDLPIRKKILVGAFALGTLLVPIIFGAAAQGDAAPLQLVRIAPNYPSEALAAKREGFVELEFTIAANGTTKDVVIVDSTSPEFEEPAVAALLRWRYAPSNMSCVAGAGCQAVENAQPVERPGIRTVINFRLADVDPRAEAE